MGRSPFHVRAIGCLIVLVFSVASPLEAESKTPTGTTLALAFSPLTLPRHVAINIYMIVLVVGVVLIGLFVLPAYVDREGGRLKRGMLLALRFILHLAASA